MKWSDITDGHFEKRADFLSAMLKHIRQQIDPDMTRQEFFDSYRELQSHLKFPLKIYRALAASHGSGEDIYFNAHEDEYDGHDHAEAVANWI